MFIKNYPALPSICFLENVHSRPSPPTQKSTDPIFPIKLLSGGALEFLRLTKSFWLLALRVSGNPTNPTKEPLNNLIFSSSLLRMGGLGRVFETQEVTLEGLGDGVPTEGSMF